MYNVEKYIRRCLESILRQTYPLIEIIVISDASPDKSAIIANEVATEVSLGVYEGGKSLNVNV